MDLDGLYYDQGIGCFHGYRLFLRWAVFQLGSDNSTGLGVGLSKGYGRFIETLVLVFQMVWKTLDFRISLFAIFYFQR